MSTEFERAFKLCLGLAQLVALIVSFFMASRPYVGMAFWKVFELDQFEGTKLAANFLGHLAILGAPAAVAFIYLFYRKFNEK